MADAYEILNFLFCNDLKLVMTNTHGQLQKPNFFEEIEGCISILGSADGIQDGDNGWDVNSSPERQVNFWHQDCSWDDGTIEHKCNNVREYLAHKEEGVQHVYFLPQLHFLQHHSQFLTSLKAVSQNS
jgi:hypothetical protein